MNLKLGRLSQVALSCTDLKRAIGFYRDVLGVEFVAEFTPPGLACFRMGQTGLLVEASHAGEEAPVVANSVLYFAVEDIDAAYAELSARGVTFDSKPHLIFRDDEGVFGRKGSETWMAFFKDPDGSVLAISEENRELRKGG
jgi:catechol 2,3-dioxygenase-like lactoylglutathione lyase family enzyme